MKPLALLSVSDKTGLIELAQTLVGEFGFDLMSSGGTAQALQRAGLPVTKVSDYTGFPEILGGRVKTLHPRIHGGILARTELEEDRQQLAHHQIRAIELVVVNLYPFQATIARPEVTPEEAIEQIDIGGPTLLRGAAKNHASVSVLCDPGQYPTYLEDRRQGTITPEKRRAWAQAAFAHTAAYDTAIAAYLSPEPTFNLKASLVQTLRYGENPHQGAAWYQTGAAPTGWARATKLQGKELSYNNLVDLEAARELIADLLDTPAAAILKHTNPCGVACGSTLEEAYQRALRADPVSAFGGVVALSRPLDVATAQALAQIFLECILVPGCDPAAQEVLQAKSRVRLMVLSDLASGPDKGIKAVAGGLLVQDSNIGGVEPQGWQVVTKAQPTPADLGELGFAWRVVKHVKSNAIVVTRSQCTLGIGAGQMNRVGSVALALQQAGLQANGAYLASDGFFPFSDSVQLAAQAGIRAIIQPGGSLRDQESIEAADKEGLIMVTTGVRHFWH